jgi:cell division protein FtsL
MSAARQMVEFENYDDYRSYILKKNVDETAKRHEIKRQNDKQHRHLLTSLRIIALSGFLFMALAFLVIRYADVYEAKYQIHSMQKEIKAVQQEIEEINASMDSTVSLENIERVAVQELKMQYPQPEQIVYLTSNWNYSLDSAIKSDYVVEDRNAGGLIGALN